MLYGLLTKLTTHLPPIKRSGIRIRKKNVKAQIGHLGKLISKTPIDKLNEGEKAASMHEASEAVKETF